MKHLLLGLILMTMVSCATQDFNSNVNCSVRALNYLSTSTHKLSRASSPELVKFGREAMVSASNQIQKCYEDALESAQGEEYNLCTVVNVDDKGVADFIDIDDVTKTISPEFNKCLFDSVGQVDFRKVPSSTLLQPVRLRVRRK